MLFGETEAFAIECEIDDTHYPSFFGKVRIWIGGVPYGDFSGEIIGVYVAHFERIGSEIETGSTDCTGCLPYVGNLSWLITTTEEYHVVCAYTEVTGIYSVVMPRPQLSNVMEEFSKWVRSHDNFILNNLPTS